TIVPLQKDHTNGLEFNIIRQTTGSKQWQQIYNYPQIGISIAYWDIGNKEKLGYGITAIPYLDFPLSKGIKHNFDLKFGWGIGYVQKIFDSDDNYKNIAIGSHLNCGLMLQPHYRYQASDHLALGAGLSLTHF
ncbi:MAG TPA: acyloxyacyl hydrolase, partial [Bacteroidia bacterium]|nr:acyloxyacyl hydrolase [Bacteroidia bacterium]